MLVCERWTLTHSSGGAVVLPLALGLGSELGLVLAAGLGSELGLVLTSAASAALVVLVVLVVLAVFVAVVLAVAVSVLGAVAGAVPVAVAVLVAVAVDVALGVPDGDMEADGDGEVVRSGPPLTATGGGNTLGGALAAEWLAVGLPELVEGDGEGDSVGDGDGDGDSEGDGDGVGVEVPEEGRAWHTVSVLLVLLVIARGTACALPSTPRVRKLPLSKVTAATLTCAKRIRIACLRCSSGLPCALGDSEATRGSDGYVYSFPLPRYICITCPPDHSRRPSARLPRAVFTRVTRI
jgi:hypothetical protein